MGAEKPVEVLVLGAGILGCALAYHLARRGVGPVRVYDPQTPAAGASGRAAGIVTEQLWNEWDVAVTRESREEYATLSKKWDPGAFRPAGFLRFTRRAETAEALEEAKERLRSWGVRIRDAPAGEVESWFPGSALADVRGTVYSPDDAVVTPSAVTTLYAEGARSLGVTFDFGAVMKSLRPNSMGWNLTTAVGESRARTVVVAAGAWSKRILASVDAPLPLCPYRTQAALLRPGRMPSDGFPSVHDLDTDVYARGEGANRILVGDGTEDHETDPDRASPSGDPEFLQHIADALREPFPEWAESEVVGAWAGVCTATPDRRPLIGAVPGAKSLYVLTGFNGFGVMRAGGSARRLADLLAEGTNSTREALAPVDPTRVTGVPLDFAPRPGFTLEPGDSPRF